MLESFKDQLGRIVTFPHPPARIISLVPSLTELAADLRLEQQIVGITKYCVHPTQWKQTKAIIGGTKDFDTGKIIDLHPDLVIGNKEENKKELIEKLIDEVPVWMSDVRSLEDALSLIRILGKITDREQEANAISHSIQSGFDSLTPLATENNSVLYLIWRKPWMGVALDTFISDILQRIGFKNSLAPQRRYPSLSGEDIKNLMPAFILLSSEPYPFAEKHKRELQQLCPQSRIMLVDGQMFSWYGSHLMKSVDYFRSLEFK